MYDSHLLRIGIFYDGNYFYHVSNYYCYAHERRSRLSISGLHDFIKRLAGRFEGVEAKFCQIVDCHYFRGRLPAMEANALSHTISPSRAAAKKAWTSASPWKRWN